MNDISNVQNIEEWFLKQDEKNFPKINHNEEEKTYPQKYEELKRALVKYHHRVESGALFESIDHWKCELQQRLNDLRIDKSGDKADKIRDLEQQIESDPAIYLNQHGVGHVEKVIEKVTGLIKEFRLDMPTSSELFILLCSIQIHDIGNIFGREGHERSFQKLFHDIAKPIIPDTVTRRLILKIAQVHSGKINGSKDTISNANLSMDRDWFDQKIREPMLAALLRFADELADDSTRYDSIAYDLGSIPERSLIYHAYSRSLHAVNIGKNPINKSCYVSLKYYLDTDTVAKEYNKNGSSILLIDEIFARTRKMEQERRYCMRFLSTYLPLTEIHVCIQIDSDYDLMHPVLISYTLKEDGYPNDDILIDCEENEGYKVIQRLESEGWRLKRENDE